MESLMVFHEQKRLNDDSVFVEFAVPVTEIHIFSEQEVQDSLAQKSIFSVDWTNINSLVTRCEVEDF